MVIYIYIEQHKRQNSVLAHRILFIESGTQSCACQRGGSDLENHVQIEY